MDRGERRKFERKVDKKWTRWLKTLSPADRDKVIAHLKDLAEAGGAQPDMKIIMQKTMEEAEKKDE